MSLREIEILPYSDLWPEMFKAEQSLLRSALGSIVIKIHHIGSTSVPNLAAKPIIDILMVVSSHKELDRKCHLMESLDYKVKGEFGIEGRRYFPKGGLDRTHQLHAFEQGSEHINRHLAFKEYLIAHPSVAIKYKELKLKVLRSCNNDMYLYCKGKDGFVKKYEEVSLKWWRNT